MEHKPEDIDRFMRYVDRLPNGCWYWMGARSRGKGNRKWYGSFRLGHRTVRAHRFASEVLGGQKCPPGYHRDHRCHFSMCVNPDHLEVVPKEVNQERKTARARGTEAVPQQSEPVSDNGLLVVDGEPLFRRLSCVLVGREDDARPSGVSAPAWGAPEPGSTSLASVRQPELREP